MFWFPYTTLLGNYWKCSGAPQKNHTSILSSDLYVYSAIYSKWLNIKVHRNRNILLTENAPEFLPKQKWVVSHLSIQTDWPDKPFRILFNHRYDVEWFCVMVLCKDVPVVIYYVFIFAGVLCDKDALCSSSNQPGSHHWTRSSCFLWSYGRTRRLPHDRPGKALRILLSPPSQVLHYGITLWTA